MLKACVVEILEPRIAPAVFFVSPVSREVLDGHGTNAQDSTNEIAANASAGTDAAVLLSGGDKLVFDVNHNHVLDRGDTVLMTVKGGRAIAFFQDRDADGVFEAGDLTGLAISSGFKAQINTDVHGDVVTALDDTGSFTVAAGTLTIQHASIASLTIAGAIAGNLSAGGSIFGVTIGQSLTGPAELPSVSGVSTGTASGNHLYNFGGTDLLSAVFVEADGAAGGDITNLTLARGAASIHAGDGGAATAGVGGRGGSVSGLKITDSVRALSVVAGVGGAGMDVLSGAGGDLTHLSITSTVQQGAVYLESGAGGTGSGAGSGGAAGSISSVTLFLPEINGAVTLLGGKGGAAGPAGLDGGHGGGLSNVLVKSSGHLTGDIVLSGGRGGLAHGAGGGGAGGSVTGATIKAGEVGGSIGLYAGPGGDGGSAGGAGGTLTKVGITVAQEVAADLGLFGGDGGDGGDTGAGGLGGGVSVSTVFGKLVGNTFTIQGGAGGDAGASVGEGGLGGSLEHLTVTLPSVRHETAFFGGPGGDGSTGFGGNGGDISTLTFASSGSLGGPLSIKTGAGGNSVSGTAGKGGNFSAGKVSLATLSASLEALGGQGGTGATGGPGGDVTAVTFSVQTLLGAGSNLVVHSGDGGGATGSGASGNGGMLSNITLRVAGVDGLLELAGGAGGDRTGANGAGGTGGLLTKSSVTVTGHAANINLVGGHGGLGFGTGAGGVGGAISELRVTAQMVSQLLKVTAGAGSTGGASAGDGGAGGELSKLTLRSAGALAAVAVASGAGGDAQALGDGGTGGGASQVNLTVANSGNITILTGAGGAGFGPAMMSDSDRGYRAGASGSLSEVTLSAGIVNGDLAIGTGLAGTASGYAQGGSGGAMTGGKVAISAGQLPNLTIRAADGTDASGAANAGQGGTETEVTLSLGAGAEVGNLVLRSGDSGAGLSVRVAKAAPIFGVILNNRGTLDQGLIRAGNGGTYPQGGTLARVTVNNSGSLHTQLRIAGGDGGVHRTAGGDIDSQGFGGGVLDVTINNTGWLEAGAVIQIQSGVGGSGNIVEGDGTVRLVLLKSTNESGRFEVLGGSSIRSGADIFDVTLAAPLADIRIGSDTAGSGGSVGGHGGSITRVHGTAGYLSIIAGSGGDGSMQGGRGGNISDVNVKATYFTQEIRAGSGGGNSNGPGGDGGSISRVAIMGDLGNFHQPFGASGGLMGGLIAGLGGTGATPGAAGSITDIKASRIAAIYAGNGATSGDSLTAANALTALSKISAAKIGADLDADGLFDFIDSNGNGTFDLGTSDRAIEGLVIALLSGYQTATISGTPLKTLLA